MYSCILLLTYYNPTMKKKIFSVLICLAPLLTMGQTKKVIMIGIDGTRPDALLTANTPALDDLIANGIYSPDALNDDITISGPGWSAILCGVWSDKHMVTGNNFTSNNYASYPHIFKLINDHDPTLHTVSICNWNPINDNITLNHADYKLNVSSDLEVATQASSYLSLNDPDILFLHFDDVDHAGHSYGFSPTIAEYIAAIEGVDAHVETVMQAIEQRPTYANEDWLVLVTTDHGGLGNSHGGTSMEEQVVFVIASGDSIATTTIVKDSSIVSNSVVNCLGDSMELELDGLDDVVQIPADSSFDFGSSQDFTLECRVRTAQTGDVSIVGNKDWDTGYNKGFVFSFKYPSGPEWKVNIGDGSNRVDINTGGQIANNEWHTLSASFDRDGYLKMYENGTLVDSADISGIGDITNGEGLYLGADINGTYSYSGSIAEVRLWNTLVSGQDITSWHCSSLDGSHPNYSDLIGYWKLNDSTAGTQAVDHSSNNHHGTINGGAGWVAYDSLVIYDYSATPRLPDVPVTALTHLCIPIDSSWSLDGNSLIPECPDPPDTTIIPGRSQLEMPDLKLVPNPTDGSFIILGMEGTAMLYDSYARLIAASENNEWNIAGLSKGIYFLQLKDENGQVTFQKLIKK